MGTDLCRGILRVLMGQVPSLRGAPLALEVPEQF